MPHKKHFLNIYQQLTYTGLNRQGAFVASIDDKQISTFGTSLHETSLTMIGSKKRKRKRKTNPSWLYEVITPSPARRDPVCLHFNHCGGCQLQHLTYREQLKLKSAYYEDLLQKHLETCKLLPPVPSPSPYYYRSKVEFSLIGLPAVPAFNTRGKWNRFVRLTECVIGPPCNKAAISSFKGWAARYRLPGWDPKTHKGVLRYLVLRYSYTTDEWLAVLVATETSNAAGRLTPQVLNDLTHRLREAGASGIIYAHQTSPAGAVKPETAHPLRGQDYLKETLDHLTLRLPWDAFFQSNPKAYLQLLREAKLWVQPILTPHSSILDLYCGVGSIGLFIAEKQQKLVGVESVASAIQAAKHNARLNKFTQAEFYCSRAEDWDQLDHDLIILDPPRSGCHPHLLHRIIHLKPPLILYLSCNPHRLKEELQFLSQGYNLKRLRFFDFFPHTRHLEILALLERSTT